MCESLSFLENRPVNIDYIGARIILFENFRCYTYLLTRHTAKNAAKIQNMKSLGGMYFRYIRLCWQCNLELASSDFYFPKSIWFVNFRLDTKYFN